MKAKYIVMIGLFAASFAACSRDEESLFDKPAAQRAQEAVTSAFDVLSSNEAGWEMAYFPNLEADAKGYNMVLKFNKNGNVSVTAKNSATTKDKIIIHGKQELDDNLYLHYSHNSYMPEWFMGRRRPKYGAALVYEKSYHSNDFLLKRRIYYVFT